MMLLNFFKKNVVFILFILITFVFFYKVFLGFVPIPADLLVGGYYPWLDYKWGYSVGVPVKNPAISDVMSQYYPWRITAMESVKNLEWPLWNPYSFSGTPLLANWQSAPFYPLNIFLLIFGNINGWIMTIMAQVLLSMIFMFLYLKEIKLNLYSCIFGATVFAFSGFMMIFLEYNSPAQSAIWLSLNLFIIERYVRSRKPFSLVFLPISIFCMVSAGNFQVSAYTILVSIAYFLGRLINLYGYRNIKKQFIVGLGFFGLGFGLSAIQIIPTLELVMLSIRQADSNIASYNYGLLPLKSLITFLVPDFFGNPTTYNFWGFLYHETLGYFGILTIPLIFIAVKLEKSFITKFFLVTFIISLLLIFDTIIGRLVYISQLPFFSTSYASRAIMILDFSAAVLAAIGLNKFSSLNKTYFVKSFVVIFGIILGILFSIGALVFLKLVPESLVLNLSISIKNMVFPSGILVGAVLVLVLIKSRKLVLLCLIVLTTLDLFRFGLKYNPFVSRDLVFPTTPAIEYVKENVGFYRIEREQSEVMPPNSWMGYKLLSPSGYDPLYYKNYSHFFSVYNNSRPTGEVSRYAELERYDSPFTDLLGVKYLIAAKRDKNGRINSSSEGVSSKITDLKYRKVFEDKSIVVLENSKVLPRTMFFTQFDIEGDSWKALNKLYDNYDFRNRVILDTEPKYAVTPGIGEVKTEIISYKSNEVKIKTSSSGNGILMLSDTYYPGWRVSVDGQETTLLLANGIFRAVSLNSGVHEVKFYYMPKSFVVGQVVFLLSSISLLFLGIFMKKFNAFNFQKK